jgi:hypothetical protein
MADAGRNRITTSGPGVTVPPGPWINCGNLWIIIQFFTIEYSKEIYYNKEG